MPGSYIVAGARTPIGKMSGALASQSAADLGGAAIAAALERAGVAPDEVDHVLMGQVLMAGQGQVPSRQAAVKAGHPRGECSWILEDNWDMRRGLERLGARVYKTYRVFEKDIGG